jgi:phosphonate transport system substrate-binding protein
VHVPARVSRLRRTPLRTTSAGAGQRPGPHPLSRDDDPWATQHREPHCTLSRKIASHPEDPRERHHDSIEDTHDAVLPRAFRHTGTFRHIRTVAEPPGTAQVTLRVLTYLAPSLPLELFRQIAAYLGETAGIPVRLLADGSRSGPGYGEPEPFSTADADVAFVCATSYVWLAGRRPPPAGLLGAAAVPTDPRAAGRPVYFTDVVTRADGPVATLADARSFACNDPSSLSGYYSLLLRMRAGGDHAGRISEVRMSGSHLNSLDLVLRGRADAAAIDSTALRIWQRAHSGASRCLRVIESWGPHPAQPVVVRAGLDPHLVATLRQALLSAHRHPRLRQVLAAAQLQRFGSVDPTHYQQLRDALARLPHATTGQQVHRISGHRTSR